MSDGFPPPCVTAAEREAAFRLAIAAVCKEHGATFDITDDGRPYGMHSAILHVTMMSVWNDGELVKAFCSFKW